MQNEHVGNHPAEVPLKPSCDCLDVDGGHSQARLTNPTQTHSDSPYVNRCDPGHHICKHSFWQRSPQLGLPLCQLLSFITHTAFV